MKLTSAQCRALEYISRHRRMGAKVGAKLSRYMVNKLKEFRLVEEFDELVILTKEGEQYFAQLRRKGKS
jgi:hypothetical protein